MSDNVHAVSELKYAASKLMKMVTLFHVSSPLSLGPADFKAETSHTHTSSTSQSATRSANFTAVDNMYSAKR